MGRDEIVARDALAWIADNDGMTRAELSERIGRNSAYVSNVAKKRSMPGTDLLADAATAAGGELVATDGNDEIVIISNRRSAPE